MVGEWSINVSGRVYGPFTSDRMRSFVGEGRLAPHSLIAREGSTDWHEARDEPEFTDTFSHRVHQATASAPAAKVATAPASQAILSPDPHAMAATQTATPSRQSPLNAAGAPSSPAARANGGEAAEQHTAHFAIIVEIKAQGTGNFESAVTSLGSCYRLTHNVWILSTEHTVSAVRNRLIQELGKTDSLFVIDASRGKAAWFNFGPEADVRIRRVWQKT
jgi:hypothetical protein